MREKKKGVYQKYLKNLLDRLLALVGTAALSWLLLGVGIAVRLDSPGPVLFRQKRVGRNGQYFYIYKFRTMRIDTPHDVPTHLLENPDQWITRVGRFLRRTSMDELPQIFNILAGQMSIIGPRPALYNQYDLIDARDKAHANDIRPGLTGLAQINGRDELPIDVKAKYDGEYAAHLTFGMDLKIFFHSFSYVFQRRGVVEGGTGSIQEPNEQKPSN